MGVAIHLVIEPEPLAGRLGAEDRVGVFQTLEPARKDVDVLRDRGDFVGYGERFLYGILGHVIAPCNFAYCVRRSSASPRWIRIP